MNTDVSSVWDDALTPQLADVLVSIDEVEVMRAFLRDVMTESEIRDTAARLEAARMLTAGESYTAIMSRTKLSSRTIARISDWLQNGSGGYAAVMNISHAHIQPDSSE